MDIFQELKIKIKLKKYSKQLDFKVDKSTFLGSCFNIIGCYSSINIGKDNVIFASIVCQPNAKVVIGNRTYINKNCTIDCYKEIFIGDDVTIGNDVTLFDSNAHSFDWKKRSKDTILANQGLKRNRRWERFYDEISSEKITLCNKSWIGCGSTILKGVTVGEGAVVGANSVVREDVEPWSIVIGNPAIKIGDVRH